MKLNYFGYIFLGPGFDHKTHRVDTRSEQCKFTAIGIDIFNKEEVLEVAKQLVAEGVQLIELCGGFGPLWIAKISEAIQYCIPVGSVAYGPEARKPMLDLLS